MDHWATHRSVGRHARLTVVPRCGVPFAIGEGMRRNRLTSVNLVAARGDAVDTTRIEREHPHVALRLGEAVDSWDAVIDMDDWCKGASFAEFDHVVVRDAREGGLALCGPSANLQHATCEVLTRYQRFMQRRNAASTSTQFDAVLQAHAALHDLTRPLVAADYDHAVDTWQWMLRLQPNVSLAGQLAGLFHDIERLESVPDRRVEPLSAEGRLLKQAHAVRGAELTARILDAVGVDDTTTARAAQIIASRERSKNADVALLDDADALSFFSLNSASYADYFGPDQTRRKVASTLRKLSSAARARLSQVRLRWDVAHWLDEATHREAA
jgi:hypothetical protein